jgi:hypothetical protein
VANSHYSSTEIKAGMFLAFCLALFVGMVLSYSRLMPMTRTRQEIFVAFDNISASAAAALQPDAPVRYNGLEVGRVKWIRVLHLNPENITRLPALTKRDLDNLPIRPETLKQTLRESSEVDFEPLCREALKNRTMIELCLEVMQDGDARRYRMDDQVRVVSTILGDFAVEIISGSGSINTSQTANLLLGTSGDFFSNLAKSMGDVKTILSNVTDVVGTQERRSFQRAQARFGNISQKLDVISEFSNNRTQVTVKRIENLGEGISKTLNESSAMLEGLQPQAQKTADSIANALKGIQEKFSFAQGEAERVYAELNGDWEMLKNDINSATQRARPEFDEMKTRIRSVYDVLGGLSVKLDQAGFTADRLLYQSEPDLRIMQDRFKRSLVHLGHFEQAAKENKDLFFANGDIGEHEFNTAVIVYRHVRMASRRINRAQAEVQSTMKMLQEEEQQADEKSGTVMKQISQSAFVLEAMKDLSGKIGAVLNEIEQRMSIAPEPKPVKK